MKDLNLITGDFNGKVGSISDDSDVRNTVTDFVLIYSRFRRKNISKKTSMLQSE